MGKSQSEMSKEELWELFPIILKEYSDDWVNWYADEEKLLTDILGKENIKRINHIGSTAVKGLLAKPTVDILLEIDKDYDIDKLINTLDQNRYINMNEQECRNPLNLTLVKGYTENGFADRVYHLHIRYLGDWNELYFRDYIRDNKKVADEYRNLKMGLKDKFKHDRDAYTDAKGEFIMKYTNIAREAYQNRYSPIRLM